MRVLIVHVLFCIFFKIHAHDDDVNTVRFANDSSHILYSGGDDGLCKVNFDRCFAIFSIHKSIIIQRL